MAVKPVQVEKELEIGESETLRVQPYQITVVQYYCKLRIFCCFLRDR